MLIYKESESFVGFYAIYDTDDGKTEFASLDDVIACLKMGVSIEGLPQDILKMAKNRNSNLTKAKKAKNDEFYTQLTDIEKELSHYDPAIFRDKVIYCPTDVATDQGKILQSQFVHYFQLKKEELKFKKLVATCLAEKGEEFNNKYVLLRKLSPYADPSSPYYNPNITEDDDKYWSWGESTSECKADENYGSGDFRSEECLRLMDEADIVVTNPPFSLFRDFIKILMDKGKKFLVVGNINSLTAKDVFPYFRNNRLWLGKSIHSGDRAFYVPNNYTLEASGCGVDEDGKRYIRVKGVRWFTNIDFEARYEFLDLLPMSHWEKQGVVYDKFDNYDAINVPKYKQIPEDYDGVMGVPISFFDFYNPKQFEILALQAGNAKGVNSENDLKLVNYVPMQGDKGGAGLIEGKPKYARILIRKRQKSNCPFNVGDYITFTYNDERFGGDVVRVDGENYFVSFETEGVLKEACSTEITKVRRI